MTIKSNTAAEDKDKWATPWWAFYFAEHWFDLPQFELDCAASEHNTKCKRFISEQENALEIEWNAQHCWLNPPYSNPLPFVEKAIAQSKQGKTVVMLLNVDNSTRWFDMCVQHASDIVYITKGRLPFIHNATGQEMKGNNKPQMFVLFNERKWKSRDKKVRSRYVSIDDVRRKGELQQAKKQ